MHCRGERYLYQLMLFIKAGNTISRGCKVILLIKDGFTYETLHQCYRCWWRKWVVTMLFYVVTTDALLPMLRASSYSVHWHEAQWLHEVSCEVHVLWSQSIRTSNHQDQCFVHLSRQLFQFYYESVAVFNFCGKSVGELSRSVFAKVELNWPKLSLFRCG